MTRGEVADIYLARQRVAHGYVKQALYDFGQIDTTSSEFVTELAALPADFEAHFQKKSEHISPLQAELAAARNAKPYAQANERAFDLAQ